MLPAPSLVHRTPGPAIAAAVLLLRGRSWLALTLPAGALTALVLGGYQLGGWGGGGSFGPVSLLAPPVAAVLSALPSVRHWVAARRSARALSTAGSRP